MKTLFTFLAIGAACFIFAQAPQAFNYSAVVRDGSGNPIPNQLVKFRLSILRGTVTGPSVYVETHSTTTDANGMVNLEIGRGTVVSGVFAAIPWNNDAFFFQVEVDPAGGNAFLLMGTTQFLSVPYALNAKYAETVAAQFGLFNNIDTIRMFKNKTEAASGYWSTKPTATIRFFGGSPEDFTYIYGTLPPYISMTPASQAFNAIQLKSQAEFTIQQNITVSNSAPVGFVTIPNMVTTASNRVTNNSFVVEVLDNCRTDGAFANNRVDINQKVGYAWCTMLGYAWDSTNTTIINPSPADCNLKFRLERYGILVDCTIDRDSIIVNSVSPLNVGPIKGGANIQNLTFTGSGNGKITFNHGKIQSATINLECDMVIYNNIPTCSIGTRTVRDYQHFYFPF